MKYNVSVLTIGCNLVNDHTSTTRIDEILTSQYESILDAVSSEKAFKITGQSRIFRTPAFPAGSGPDFRNGALKLETDLSAEAVLSSLHEIEQKFNRERPFRWSPRTCDLDLIYHNDEITPNLQTWNRWHSLTNEDAQRNTPNTLICPHPRMDSRAFVLGPLMDIIPEHIHPVLHKTTRELWEALPNDDRNAIKPIE